MGEIKRMTNSSTGGPVFVDVQDGKILRMYPMELTEDDAPSWEIEARGRTFTPPRKTTITPVTTAWAGKVLLKEAYVLVNKASETFKKIQLAASGVTGYLKVGFLGGIEKVFLPQAVRDLRNLYPDIYVSLHQYNWAELNEALMKEELDVGFTLSHRLNDFPDLVGRTLRTDVLCVVIHSNHPLASEKMIDVSALVNEPFVMFARQADYLLNDLTYKICADHGFTPNIVNQSRDLAALLFMVEAGLGIMIVPGPVREIAGPELRVIELSHTNRYFDVMVAWNRNNQNASTPVFVNHLSSYSLPKKDPNNIQC